MDCYNDDMELDAFSEKTTYQNDYKPYCGHKPITYRFERDREETSIPPPAKQRFEDHESFSKWKEDVHIPFNLLWRPKPILQEDPRAPFEQLVPSAAGIRQKEEAIRTRPRIYMTPSVSLDDVPDPKMRELLCEFMYTTEWRKAEKEATANFKRVVPNIERMESLNVDKVKYQVDLHKPLDSRFTELGREWEDNQLRGDSDPTRSFWIHKDPPVVCGACVNPIEGLVPTETREKISHLISEDKLRLPHDKCVPNYAGYRPMLPKGVPLAKTELPVTHPMLSVSQAISSRYSEELKK